MVATSAPPRPVAGCGDRASVALRGWLREGGELMETIGAAFDAAWEEREDLADSIEANGDPMRRAGKSSLFIPLFDLSWLILDTHECPQQRSVGSAICGIADRCGELAVLRAGSSPLSSTGHPTHLVELSCDQPTRSIV